MSSKEMQPQDNIIDKKRRTKGGKSTPNNSRTNSPNPNNNKKRTSSTWQCKTCSLEFSDPNDKLLECQRCKDHYCIKCLGKTVEEYSWMTKSDDTMWFCTSCREKVEKNILVDREIEERCKEMTSKFEIRLKALEEAINNKCEEERVREIVKERLDQMVKKVDSKADSGVVVNLEERVKCLEGKEKSPQLQVDANEIEERLKRNQNLIFFNITESCEEEARDRVTDDTKNVETVLGRIEVTGCEFEQPMRLGKKGETPRPLKIRFKTKEMCTTILKSANKLKGSDTYISKDMTPLERIEWKALLKERDRKRQEALDNGDDAWWVIRKGKVINVARGERQPPGQAVKK